MMVGGIYGYMENLWMIYVAATEGVINSEEKQFLFRLANFEITLVSVQLLAPTTCLEKQDSLKNSMFLIFTVGKIPIRTTDYFLSTKTSNKSKGWVLPLFKLLKKQAMKRYFYF